MKVSPEGLELIKQFEGVRLEAYPDPATGAEPWTIGVGHTGPDVYPGKVITQDEADDLLRADLETAEKCIANCVKVTLMQEQYDAIASLIFNIGCRNFGRSTLLRKLNDGDDEGAGREFPRWNMAAGKKMAGLTRRREAERDRFLA